MKFTYVVTKQLLHMLTEIAVLEREVARLSLTPALRTSLYQAAKIGTSHFSNKIEGNCLTREQTEDVWKKKKVEAPKRDIQEVKNLFELFDYLIEKSKSTEPLTAKLVCAIHRYVEKNIVKGKLLGNYRESQNAIFDAETNRVVYMPPKASEVPKLVDELLERLNATEWEHDLIKAAIAHFGLVTIHPFMDGNGRTARALSTYLMMRDGFLFVRAMAWDEYFYQHRAQYYEFLHEAQGKNFYEREYQWDVQRWLEYFIGGVAEMLRHFLEQTRGVSEAQPLNNRQEKALRLLTRKGKLTNREYRELNRVSNFTALMDLRSMEEQGLLKRIGQGRSAQYVLK